MSNLAFSALRRGPFAGALATAFVCTCVIPATLGAQAPAPLQRGTTSLSFALPQSNAPTIGIWRFFSDRDNVGLELGFQARGGEVDTPVGEFGAQSAWGVSVGPSWKRYFAAQPRVAPFARLGAEFAYANQSAEPFLRARFEETHWSIGGTVGLGADWFPLDVISIGGFVGVSAQRDQADGHNDFVRTSWSFGTRTSALSLHIYF